jgi:serine O-acetyltransferase
VTVVTLRPAESMTLAQVWRDIQSDIEQCVRCSSDFSGTHLSVLRRLSFMCSPPVLCSATYRVSHWLYRRGLPRVAGAVSWLNFVVHRADLAASAEIGPGLYVPHTSGVIFRGRAGSHLTLLFRSAVVGNRLDGRRDRVGPDCPRLGDHVTLGVFSVIKGPVTVGDHAFVGAVATIQRDVPAHVAIIPGRQVPAAGGS